MFSFSYIMRRFTVAAAKQSLSKHDPNAFPLAPILRTTPPLPHRSVVHWWDASTVGILGLLSPTLPHGFCPTTGASRLLEFSAVLSWSTIADSDSYAEADDASQCFSYPDTPDLSASLISDESEEALKYCFVDDGRLAVFGRGQPLKRVSTITRNVGIAKRNRRSVSATGREWFDAAPFNRWRRQHKKHVPHVLTCIVEEDEDQENC